MSIHLALEAAIDDEGGSIDHLAHVVDDGSFASASDGARVVRAHAWAHDSSSTSAPEMNDGADDDEDAPLEAVRRAFESYAVSSPMRASDARRGSRLVATHVGFHGASPAAATTTTGRYLIAAQRDGALAMWRKGRDDRWVAQAEAPYAGAPPIVANALERGDSRLGDAFAATACSASDGGVYCATLSEDGDGGGWLVLRKIGVDGETTTTTATVRYADARGLEGAGGEDFWVTTTSGTFYRWNCRLGRAVARVNVWNAMNDDDDDGECVARRAGRALLTSKSYPNDALLCFDADAGRGYELLPALSAPNARSDVTTRDHTVQRVCAIQRAKSGDEASTSDIVSAARHGAFVWTASVDGERRSIDVYHAITGAHIASTDVPAPIVSQPTAASKVWSQSPVFEVLNAGAMGVFARVYVPGALAPAYRCSIHVPSALAKIVEPVVLDPTAHGVERIDRLLVEMKSFGGCIEPLSHALVMARKEAETAPEAFKTKRGASDSLDLQDARVSCSFAPALLLKARLTGRFDDVAAARWNFAAKEAIEALENAARGDGAFSRLASEKVDETRDILLRDWEAARASATSTARETETETTHVSTFVHELETARGAKLPAFAWVSAAALRALSDSESLEPFVNAVWNGKPLVIPTDDAELATRTRAFVDAARSRVDASLSANDASLSAFEATMHLVYRIAPRYAIALIDAVVAETGASRVDLAKRAVRMAESPGALLDRFGDGDAADALARAIAETLCAADLARSGVYVALTFGGLYGARPKRAYAQRGKTTLAGWDLAHDVLVAEIDHRRHSIDDARRFAAETFEVMSKSFRTLIEDWNDLPLRQSAADVDVDVAAEVMLRTADVVRSLYDDGNARVETRSPVLDVARRHTTTITEVRAAAARGQDSEETVDSLERLIVAVTATLRARNASERDEA